MSQTDVGPERESPPGVPRWVKLFGIVALVLVLLVGIILLTGLGGDHGPGRHMPSGAAGDTPPSSVIEDTLHPAMALAATHRPPEHGVQQP